MAVVNEFIADAKTMTLEKTKPKGFVFSRKRISRILRNFNFVLKYMKAQYKKSCSSIYYSRACNELNRKFNQERPLKVAVTNLTYVRVGGNWHYICLIVDLVN